MSRLICVPPDMAADIWPHVEHHIRNAMRRGGMGNFTDVEAAVLDGPDLLWIVLDGGTIHAAGVTSLSRDKVCTIVAFGGDYAKCSHFLSGIEKFARDEGCRAVRICGRPGWQRRLSGYRTKKVIIEKAL